MHIILDPASTVKLVQHLKKSQLRRCPRQCETRLSLEPLKGLHGTHNSMKKYRESLLPTRSIDMKAGVPDAFCVKGASIIKFKM